MAGSSRANSPASTSCITCAAITDLVILPMASWSSGRMSRTPFAVPTAPLQVPLALITVAVIPPPPAPLAASLRIAWNTAAASSETGSSRMSANAAVGKAAARSLGDQRHAHRVGRGSRRRFRVLADWS